MERLTTVTLADKCKSLTARDSCYGLAQLLGVHVTTVTNWYRRGMVMDDATAIVAAELLALPPERVLIWLQFERVLKRGDDTLSRYWQTLAVNYPV
jgi:hypothetical protein